MLVTLLLTTLVTVNAQNEEGEASWMVKAGLNLSTMAGDDAKMIPGVGGGFEMEYGLNDQFGLVAGVLGSMQGEKRNTDDLKLMLNYVNVPLMVQFYPVKGLAFKTGVQLGFLLNRKAELDGVRIDLDNLENLTGLSSDFRKFDLAIPLGISYELMRFVLDVRYNMGLISILKDESYRNSVVQFTLGYKFPI